tara:strand:- start:9363 stop:10862 length:1500 start_codon:yes stop_codon:yes gene_type:complete
MHRHNNHDSDSRIEKVTFDILTEAQKKKISVRTITNSQANDTSQIPLDDGVMSLFLGSTTNNVYCKTCYKKGSNCSGHIGRINLAVPLYNPLTFNDLKKCLSVVCFWCSKSLISHKHEFLKNKFKSSEDAVYHAYKFAALQPKQPKRPKYRRVFCSCCKGIQPTYTIDEHKCLATFCEDSKGMQQLLQSERDFAMKHNGKNFSAQMAFYILRDVPESFWKGVLRLKHPLHEYFILHSILVPPPSTRPTYFLNYKIRQHETTKMLQTIIRLNNDISSKLEKNQPVSVLAMILQQTINRFLIKDFGNKKAGIQNTFQSICFSIQGKQGLIRKHLLGKRSGNNGRTVIGCCPSVDVGTCIIPSAMASNLTIPETVSYWNIEKLKKTIMIGAQKIYGADYIVKTNNEKISLMCLSTTQATKICNHLQFGDIVHRHLQNNDYCLLNRAPTLTKNSILGHKIIVDTSNKKTIRFNPCSCATYNADFDGDEARIFFFLIVVPCYVI